MIALALLAALSILSSEASASEDFPPFKLGISTQIVVAGFELRPKSSASPSTKLTYRPAQANYAGVILGYRWIGGTLSFSYPANADVRALEGISQYRDYRLTYYTSRIGLEFSYTRYVGYLIENSSELSATTLNGQQYYKLNDLRTLGFGANIFYVLSSDTYSLPAAMDQSALQAKSGGSAIVLASWRRQTIDNGTPLIPTEKQSDYGADQLVNSADTTAIAAGMGYGYNFVHGPFFASGMLGLTLGYQSAHFWIQDYDSTVTSAGANVHARIGLGLNARRYFLVAGFYFDRFGQETSSIQIGNNIYGVTFGTGLRF